MTLRVLIVDDHPAVREGLALRINAEPDLEVCGEAADIDDALEAVVQAHPDVAVVDIQLKTGDGLDLVKRVKGLDESVRILVWSIYPEKLYAERALKAGALGYINKEETTGQIAEAIRSVGDGKVFVSDQLAGTLVTQTVRGRRSLADSPVDALSDRELEVFRLIGEGLSTGQIAKRLGLSTHTIDTHRQRAKEKLRLANASALVQAATRWVLERK